MGWGGIKSNVPYVQHLSTWITTWVGKGLLKHNTNTILFIEVCRRRVMKVNGGESKVMLLGGEEGLECEV